MPLEKGKSASAFKHNVEAEVHAGAPEKQAVAIAYKEKGEDARLQADAARLASGEYVSGRDRKLMRR